jgi:hypothetical protein
MLTLKNTVRKTMLAGLLVAAVSALCGCNDYGLGSLIGLGFPDSSLYDPTAEIQSVIEYRQSVTDYYADAWSDYILE